MFSPGQTVLCVHTAAYDGSEYKEIHVGVTYIVREAFESFFLPGLFRDPDHCAVRLVGIKRQVFFGVELAFDSNCFMPIGDIKKPVSTKEIQSADA